VSFQRLLAALGAVQLEGDDCTGYSEPRYTRLFDFALPMKEPQKVGLVYGLGDCDVTFEVSAPEFDVLLGPNVTAHDVQLMRAEADDAWISEPERMSVFVVGEATRDGATKRFEWAFRMEYDLKNCVPGPNGEPGSTLRIDGGTGHARTIIVDPTELFRASADADALIRFDALAESDTDGDDVVTLEELDAVTVSGPGERKSVAELLYETLVPRMARPLGSGLCEIELDN
jgi:hypothetical protein